jgi:hypothetical protein
VLTWRVVIVISHGRKLSGVRNARSSRRTRSIVSCTTSSTSGRRPSPLRTMVYTSGR